MLYIQVDQLENQKESLIISHSCLEFPETTIPNGKRDNKGIIIIIIFKNKNRNNDSIMKNVLFRVGLLLLLLLKY